MPNDFQPNIIPVNTHSLRHALDIIFRSRQSVFPSVRETEKGNKSHMEAILKKSAADHLTDMALRRQKMTFRELPKIEGDKDDYDPYFDITKYEARLTVLSEEDAETLCKIIFAAIDVIGPEFKTRK